ncbi:hypothetical protein FisN_25Hu107 [Fistulifera solaris]|uniref:Uncharacterized protein n=1 Tax=Fistulifera solaris TaxID=1519565 RepID=A0A1Z5JVR0_FISSO|nr:hypothetical protein FisN_25Hu107 [Fistulifera solaris]|eukprot:GAX18125.1 hypothetical protein FisN_25Hu107 [Fistulifera solaris]
MAFQPGALPSANVASSKTVSELYAWTLPIDTKAAFGTWYTELHPTFRETTYEDPPFEYSYVPLHDDWMSTKYLTSETIPSSLPSQSANIPSTSPSPNRNPVRLAVNLAKRIRFNDK